MSEDLVPGDIIVIRSTSTMQCDAALLNGNVIVNESMLTGESIPVTKVQIPYYKTSPDYIPIKQPFEIRDHTRFILFSGTTVIQTRDYEGDEIRAVVIRTGTIWSYYSRNTHVHFVAFSTSKGELIRSILYPKPIDFKFNTDTYKYVGGTALIAVVGVIFSLVLGVKMRETI